MRVLLIEDNPGDAVLVQEQLGQGAGLGWDVVWADRAAKGLEQLASGAFDAILLDLSLPDADGNDGVTRVVSAAPSTPLIVLTGSGHEGLARAALRCGAQDYLLKGKVDGHGLRRAVEYAIERKRMNQDMLVSEQKYRTLLATIPDVTWTMDAQGTVLFVSPNVERVLGWSPADLRASWADKVHPDDEARVQEAFRRQVETGFLDIEYRFRKRDGSWAWVHSRGLMTFVSDGARLSNGISTDVTARHAQEEELKRAYAKLKEADEFRTQFVNNAVHELNNPLVPLKTYAYMLQRDQEDASARREAINHIVTATERLRDLVRDVLDSAKLQAGRVSLRPADTDLAVIARQCAERFGPVAQEAGIALHVDAPEKVPVTADPRRLDQVIVNLLSNALKFTPPSGRIDLTVRSEEDGGCTLRVTDTGPGLTPAQASQLFQPFRQVHEEAVPKGTGLGLYICRGLVEQHGGTIGVDSTGPGKGASFWFRLPATPPGQRPMEAIAS